jgi:hypothetical protein
MLERDAALNFPVYGINIACGWPLPETVKKDYELLCRNLIEFESGYAYIYPYHQTHITIATIVDFRAHISPSSEEVNAVNDFIPLIEKSTSSIIEDFRKRFGSIKLKFEQAYLSSAAGYLRIQNPGNEIKYLRSELGRAIASLADDDPRNKSMLSGFNLPDIVHSTFLRFIRIPEDFNAFRKSFDAATAKIGFGNAEIDEILLTSETKPYMLEGHVISRYSLKD